MYLFYLCIMMSWTVYSIDTVVFKYPPPPPPPENIHTYNFFLMLVLENRSVRRAAQDFVNCLLD